MNNQQENQTISSRNPFSVSGEYLDTVLNDGNGEPQYVYVFHNNRRVVVQRDSPSTWMMTYYHENGQEPCRRIDWNDCKICGQSTDSVSSWLKKIVKESKDYYCPCPFCGSVWMEAYSNSSITYVECLSCKARGPLVKGGFEVARYAWNRSIARDDKFKRLVSTINYLHSMAQTLSTQGEGDAVEKERR